MKKLFFIIYCFIPLTIWSQQNYNIIYHLNGKEFLWDNTFINPSSIKSIHIEKVPPDAKVYIETKDKEWKFRSLNEVLISLHNYNQIKAPDITPVYIINSEVIDNPDSIKIDETYFAHADLRPLANVKQIKDLCKTIVLIDIDLSDNPNKWTRIRGDFPELDSIRK